MTIIIDPFMLPEKGKVDLSLQRSFEINITAQQARHQVRNWLREEVSMQIDADQPTLVVGETVVWRIPAILSSPGVGRVGIVGVVEVDVSTGAMDTSAKQKSMIERQAQALIAHLPPFQPKGAVPPKFRPSHLPLAPKIIFDEHGFPVTVPADAQTPGQ
ncbi:MAG: hypothetical protein KDJ65_09170 [Anaerolineae bacterium]|nr:hypothetical protein [Anaerolineae bacterium]